MVSSPSSPSTGIDLSGLDELIQSACDQSRQSTIVSTSATPDPTSHLCRVPNCTHNSANVHGALNHLRSQHEPTEITPAIASFYRAELCPHCQLPYLSLGSHLRQCKSRSSASSTRTTNGPQSHDARSDAQSSGTRSHSSTAQPRPTFIEQHDVGIHDWAAPLSLYDENVDESDNPLFGGSKFAQSCRAPSTSSPRVRSRESIGSLRSPGDSSKHTPRTSRTGSYFSRSRVCCLPPSTAPSRSTTVVASSRLVGDRCHRPLANAREKRAAYSGPYIRKLSTWDLLPAHGRVFHAHRRVPCRDRSADGAPRRDRWRRMHGARDCGCRCDRDAAARRGCRVGSAASSCSGPQHRKSLELHGGTGSLGLGMPILCQSSQIMLSGFPRAPASNTVPPPALKMPTHLGRGCLHGPEASAGKLRRRCRDTPAHRPSRHHACQVRTLPPSPCGH
jgi:hypothetical protein